MTVSSSCLLLLCPPPPRRHYMTINGDTTIGIHKDWTEYLPGGNASFPEGVDCMISGFITYVAPEN